MTDTVPEGNRIIVWRKHYLNARRKRRFRSICEVLREVYRAAEERGDVLTMTKMDEATDMAKRMQERLEDHSGHTRTALLHFEDGYAWVSKNKLLELSEDEVSLIEFKRVKEAKRAAKAAKAAAKVVEAAAT